MCSLKLWIFLWWPCRVYTIQQDELFDLILVFFHPLYLLLWSTWLSSKTLNELYAISVCLLYFHHLCVASFFPCHRPVMFTCPKCPHLIVIWSSSSPFAGLIPHFIPFLTKEWILVWSLSYVLKLCIIWDENITWRHTVLWLCSWMEIQVIVLFSCKVSLFL